MENLQQRIERLKAEKETDHRPELMNDFEYADWLDSLDAPSVIKPDKKPKKSSIFGKSSK